MSNEYACKFKVLGWVYMQEEVGKDESSTRSLEVAQQQFLEGQMIPLCVGWFGKIRRDFDKVVNVAERAAAALDNGMSISPL